MRRVSLPFCAVVSLCALVVTGCLAEPSISNSGRVTGGHKKIRSAVAYMQDLFRSRPANNVNPIEYIGVVGPTLASYELSGELIDPQAAAKKARYTLVVSTSSIDSANILLIYELEFGQGRIIQRTLRSFIWDENNGWKLQLKT